MPTSTRGATKLPKPKTAAPRAWNQLTRTAFGRVLRDFSKTDRALLRTRRL